MLKKGKQINLMEQLLQKERPGRITKNQEIEAKIISISKKGVLFDIGGKAHAVLGQMEQKEISTYLPYLKEGLRIKVRVVTPESKDGYPVVSMRNFFQKGKWNILKEKKEKEEEIEVVCGDYGKGGVFVDFFGIRGVIPKIQLVEPYINNPEKLQGKKIKVKILEADEDKNRLVVSQRAAVLKISQKKLHQQFDKIMEGKRYKAKILGVSDFGIFCEVEGVEGLIHISEISWQKVENVEDYVKIGQTIEVVVIEKNKDDLKLNLSIKRLVADPWEDIEKKYPKDTAIQGEVVGREKYGYFVRLEPGVEGLIHVSKLTGKEDFKPGDKITVFIEKINKKNRRMSLLLPQKEKPVTYR